MTFLQKSIFSAITAALLALPVMSRADTETNATPDFKEVYDLLRTHLSGETESDLNRDAVQGLLQKLHAKVSVVGNSSAPSESLSSGAMLAKSALYDGPVAYLRITHVGDGLANRISAALKELQGTNQLKGVVLDLRFADGQDYAAAVAVADLFIAKEKPLLDWGHGVVQSKEKSDAISLPVAVLINQQTSAAAEALGAMLREDDRAVLLGSNTAGEASMSQDFPLKDGQYLRIATSAVKLGNGDALSSQGVRPDIHVNVKADDERAYYADPFKDIPSASGLIASIVGESTANAANGTNRLARPRQINEAELMRERKERPGVEVDGSGSSSPEHDPEVEKPVVRDPVLGRALDLVKGISVMRRTRGS